MKEYINLLKTCSLFSNIPSAEITKLLEHTKAYIRNFEANETVISQQDKVNYIGIILCGSAKGVKIDVTGKLTVLTQLLNGDVFGDVLAVSRGHESPVSVVSTCKLHVLVLPYDELFHQCSNGCECHEQLLKNLTQTISEKYFDLHDRINCLLCTTLREKIMSFLYLQANNSINTSFNIPFDREGLSVYLNANRSALSRELAKMKAEGVIDYYKNTFRLLKSMNGDI